METIKIDFERLTLTGDYVVMKDFAGDMVLFPNWEGTMLLTVTLPKGEDVLHEVEVGNQPAVETVMNAILLLDDVVKEYILQGTTSLLSSMVMNEFLLNTHSGFEFTQHITVAVNGPELKQVASDDVPEDEIRRRISFLSEKFTGIASFEEATMRWIEKASI